MKRVFAWAGILMIAAAFIALILSVITGASSGTILACMVCLLVLPTLFYGLSIFARLREDRSGEGSSGKDKTNAP